MQVSHTISHSMCIFTKNQRTGISPIHMPAQSPNSSIHRTVDIRFPFISSSLILNGSCGIKSFGQHVVAFKERPIARLIAQTPNNNGSGISITLHHAIHPLIECICPVFIICQGRMRGIFHTMTLQISLVNKIKSIFRTKVIPFWTVWIM